MPLTQLLIVLIVLGVILYLVNTFIPMAPPIKTLVNIVVVLIICIWLLGFIGMGSYMVPHR